MEYMKADNQAQADSMNVKVLMTGGLTRDEANLVVDMVKHFEQQLDELTLRTITSLVAGTSPRAALAGSVVIGITCERRGDTVKTAVLELLEGKL